MFTSMIQIKVWQKKFGVTKKLPEKLFKNNSVYAITDAHMNTCAA